MIEQVLMTGRVSPIYRVFRVHTNRYSCAHFRYRCVHLPRGPAKRLNMATPVAIMVSAFQTVWNVR
jgi:hypothetical protein